MSLLFKTNFITDGIFASSLKQTHFMATYCFFNIKKVHDEQAMDTYRSRVLETVSHFNGKYIVVGGPYELKEGNWQPVYPVIIEFPDLENANNWYHSVMYEPLKNLRISSVEADAVFMQGI
ncbi:MAG: DUF1330 domain-containing protein [Chitinophagaceae bacterium]|nr:DUF1330 domain-containing protein [Chitinophagaceae bacterium]